MTGLILNREWKKERLFRVALFLVLLVIGSWAHADPKPVASVGEISVSETDIGYRIGAEQAYGISVDRAAALVMLVNDALEHEVAQSAGVEVSPRDVDAFEVQVEKRSKAPEVLKKVKLAFEDDMEAYRQLYLTPKLINRKLRSWFSRDAGMQKKPRMVIQRAYALAAAGNDFAQAAKATGLRFAKQDYGSKNRDTPEALRTYFPKKMTMLSPAFQKILDGLKAGEMAHTISEDDVSYRVLRLVDKADGSYKTEEIIAAKEPFDPWFNKQIKKVPVRIQDKDLRVAIAVKYPQLVWNLSGENTGRK